MCAWVGRGLCVHEVCVFCVRGREHLWEWGWVVLWELLLEYVCEVLREVLWEVFLEVVLEGLWEVVLCYE